jgi:hypothetical protein
MKKVISCIFAMMFLTSIATVASNASVKTTKTYGNTTEKYEDGRLVSRTVKTGNTVATTKYKNGRTTSVTRKTVNKY